MERFRDMTTQVLTFPRIPAKNIVTYTSDSGMMICSVSASLKAPSEAVRLVEFETKYATPSLLSMIVWSGNVIVSPVNNKNTLAYIN